MRRTQHAVVVAGALFWVLATASGASAHANLLGSTPASGAQVDVAPASVELRFSEPLDIGPATVIEILSTSGTNVGGRVAAAPGEPSTARVPFTAPGTGVYTVTWRVLSSVDGHVTAGAFAFGVGVSPEGAVIPEAKAPIYPTPGAAVGRWLLLAGIVAMIGAGWMLRFAFSVQPPALHRLAWWGMVAATVGTVVLGDAQRRAAGLSFTDFRTTSLYAGTLARLAPLLVAAAIVAFRPRLLWLATTLGGAVVAAVHASRGHAGAQDIASIAIAQQTVHIVAASVWVGGLAALLLVLRSLERDVRDRAVRTLSRVALWAVVVVIGSGSVRTLGELGGIGNIDSRYGALVVAKVVLLVGLIAMGAVNRYRNVPRVADEPKHLTRVVRAEVVVMVAVLGVTAVLAGTTPPSSEASAAARTNVTASGADFATTVRAALTATPGTPGVNAFAVTLRAFDGDAPIDDVTVRARFAYAGGGDPVPPTVLELTRVAPGSYEASGSNLAFAGPWEITVEIIDGTAIRRVDLALGTRPASPPRAIEVAGQPTIYDIDTGALGTVQMYVDPSKAGANEVHATFFDPAGTEPSGYSEFALSALGPDGTIARLPLRMLTPAHAVASVDLTPGSWRFDVFARGPGGERVSGSFDEVIR